MTTQLTDNRSDFETAQFVDTVIMYLSANGKVARARHYMTKHCVPNSVQSRVLNNTASIRRRSLGHLQYTIGAIKQIEAGL